MQCLGCVQCCSVCWQAVVRGVSVVSVVALQFVGWFRCCSVFAVQLL